MTRLTIAAGALAALLTLTACGSDSNGSGPSGSGPPAASPGSSHAAGGGGDDSSASSTKLIIKDFQYSGKLTVQAGAKVTVTNKDTAPHTVTSEQDKMFDSGKIDGGGTGSFTAPTKPGKYPFGCTFHPDMAGTLVVTA